MQMNKPFDQFLKPKRTFEAILDLLKGRIFSGQYRAGDRLPAERDLAETLGIGRPAVREAYRALELLGIVEIRKGKEGGAFICLPSFKPLAATLTDLLRLRAVSIAQLTEARLAMEKSITELLVRRLSNEDLDGLRAMVDQAVAKAESGTPAGEDNIAFHLRLAEIAGNPVLVLVLGSIMDLMSLAILSAKPDPAITRAVAEDHYRILEALASREFDRVWPVMEAHIRESNARLAAIVGRAFETVR